MSQSINESSVSETEQTSSGQTPEQDLSQVRKKRPSPWKRFLFNVVMIFLVYVFSFGPMYWHWYRAMYLGGDPFLVRLYAPLIWLGQFEYISDCLDWYLQWWIL